MTVQSLARVLEKLMFSKHTRAFTEEKSRISVQTVGGVLPDRVFFNDTNAFTQERSRITAQDTDRERKCVFVFLHFYDKNILAL